jgi:hypothetical protein
VDALLTEAPVSGDGTCEKIRSSPHIEKDFGWLFFKLVFAARGPFDSSPVYFNEGEVTCPGVYFSRKSWSS